MMKIASSGNQSDMPYHQCMKKSGAKGNTRNITKRPPPMMTFLMQNNYGTWLMKLAHRNHLRAMARPRWGKGAKF